MPGTLPPRRYHRCRESNGIPVLGPKDCPKGGTPGIYPGKIARAPPRGVPSFTPGERARGSPGNFPDSPFQTPGRPKEGFLSLGNQGPNPGESFSKGGSTALGWAPKLRTGAREIWPRVENWGSPAFSERTIAGPCRGSGGPLPQRPIPWSNCKGLYEGQRSVTSKKRCDPHEERLLGPAEVPARRLVRRRDGFLGGLPEADPGGAEFLRSRDPLLDHRHRWLLHQEELSPGVRRTRPTGNSTSGGSSSGLLSHVPLHGTHTPRE